MPAVAPGIDPFAPDAGEARKLLAELPGGCPAPAVLSRWCISGRLRAVKYRGAWVTTRSEIRRFLAASTVTRTETSDVDHDAIERRLIERGYARGDQPTCC